MPLAQAKALSTTKALMRLENEIRVMSGVSEASLDNGELFSSM
jgi:hypothetical protein